MVMASSSSCSSPSSSAVTIPVPGKSILKRPPPAQTGILSRIKGFLPTQPSVSPSDDIKPLKRAHFILPQLAVIYPFSSVNPPSTPALKDEKKAIEDHEAERRKRIVRGNSIGPNETEEWWSLDKVESFYRECCTSREEEPDPAVSAAFKRASSTNPRSVDLSGVQLTPTTAAVLSDVLSIEWGLRKLTLRECDLDEIKLKVVLHALLIPRTLVYLSVASNRRLKAPAFKVISSYASEAKNLQFLDLSQTSLDKKAVEYINACLATASESGLVSLRLDDCSLRQNALEALSRVVRTSSLRNISLRHNRITATGAVALALMIRDYPDVVPAPSPVTSPSVSSSPLLPTPAPSIPPSLSSSLLSPPTSPLPTNTPLPQPLRTGPVLPPPRHPASTGLQTTYTPYIPRSKRAAAAVAQAHAQQVATVADSRINAVPLITSNARGGVTTRLEPLENGHGVGSGGIGTARRGAGAGGGGGNGASTGTGVSGRPDDGLSAALLDKVRALDALPRLGALKTLDLRGNDLRNGVTYLAQVLKRNRTLKVLNLAENKLDALCLAAIAEALKYNLSLETLDLSRNPCCGPGLEGIQSLRTAFTLNTALKRLFLSSTQLTSPGAIALAEFLPESRSLLHLDLTDNRLDLAGVMALSKGIQGNWVIRCLDLNIPPDDEEFALMCREILNTCIRNTEEVEKASQAAAAQASGKGSGKGVWGLIEESELARSIRRDEAKVEGGVIARAEALLAQIEKGVPNVPSKPSLTVSPSSGVSPSLLSSSSSQSSVSPRELQEKAQELVRDLTVQIQSTPDASKLEPLLLLCDRLNSAISSLCSSKPMVHKLGIRTEGLSAYSPNGIILHTSPISMTEEDDELPTPRVDKGKGRAEPEPEEPEKVLSPSFMISESEDDDESYESAEGIAVTSPTDRSKSWVAEEGEIFRKGAVLLGPEEMEGDHAGEDLRRELLEAMVERAPPRSIVDDFAMDLGFVPPLLEEPPRSPITEELQPQKPLPRPYLSWNRSTSSSNNTAMSPTLDSPSVRTPTSPLVPMSPGTKDNGPVVKS